MITQPADDLANQLTTPMPPAADEFWQVQSLSRGTAGIALLHIERAHARAGTWTSAHRWVKVATADSVIDSDQALYLGAPATCAMLQAAADQIPVYTVALTKIFPAVMASAHRRVDAALTRIKRGEAATFDEYDLFRGLTGIGRLLLEQEPGKRRARTYPRLSRTADAPVATRRHHVAWVVGLPRPRPQTARPRRTSQLRPRAWHRCYLRCQARSAGIPRSVFLVRAARR